MHPNVQIAESIYTEMLPEMYQRQYVNMPSQDLYQNGA